MSESRIRGLWDAMSRLPGGKRLFGLLVGRAAPYTSTIDARVTELRDGYACVTLDDRRAVRNHLDCIHAIALVNLAELTGNLALAYSIPANARFIVSGLAVEYLKKARGRIVATCDAAMPTTNERNEYPVEVVLRNADGAVVTRVTLRTLVGPV